MAQGIAFSFLLMAQDQSTNREINSVISFQFMCIVPGVFWGDLKHLPYFPLV